MASKAGEVECQQKGMTLAQYALDATDESSKNRPMVRRLTFITSVGTVTFNLVHSSRNHVTAFLYLTDSKAW